MLLNRFFLNFIMVKRIKNPINSLQIYGYTYNKSVITPLFNRVFTQLKGGINKKR